MLYDLAVFQTPAEQLVTSLKQFSYCSYDMEDEQLSTNYEFNDIRDLLLNPRVGKY